MILATSQIGTHFPRDLGSGQPHSRKIPRWESGRLGLWGVIGVLQGGVLSQLQEAVVFRGG